MAAIATLKELVSPIAVIFCLFYGHRHFTEKSSDSLVVAAVPSIRFVRVYQCVSSQRERERERERLGERLEPE